MVFIEKADTAFTLIAEAKDVGLLDRGIAPDTAFTLIAEAKDVGLLDRGIAPDALDIAIEHLRRLMETPADPEADLKESGGMVGELLQEKDALTQKHRRLKESIA